MAIPKKAIPKLCPGATGNMVRALQHALIANGYAAPTTGTFDDATTAALEAFQDSNALPVRPLCDNTTWAALGPA
jgi:peptidoglycan hydrolase-like protein with peptidoglycan-binding domain